MKTKIELLRELDYEMELNKVLVTKLYKFRRREFTEEEEESYEIYNDEWRKAKRKKLNEW